VRNTNWPVFISYIYCIVLINLKIASLTLETVENNYFRFVAAIWESVTLQLIWFRWIVAVLINLGIALQTLSTASTNNCRQHPPPVCGCYFQSHSGLAFVELSPVEPSTDNSTWKTRDNRTLSIENSKRCKSLKFSWLAPVRVLSEGTSQQPWYLQLETRFLVVSTGTLEVLTILVI